MAAGHEQIIRTDYADIMQRSYIDYAMSVIVSRAIPDVRDGLKPVQRRTLYDMNELGIRWDGPYRKSARIVGDTMGKYHPHGDSSIYDALVVMAQDFKRGMALVDGHGNFGSIEGDGAAAMRYTEARLEKFTQMVFLADLDKNVIDYVPNFDGTEREPEVLPVRVPNILINGSEGIAVGMTTSIPPHNLSEVIDAVKAFILDGDISLKKLMKYIKGPDFPTGGYVVNKSELEKIYETGTGKIRLRGKIKIEESKMGRHNLVITEIPYTMTGSGIGKFLNDVAALVESKVTTDITDISNQSSKEGIRIVLELKKGTDIENLKNLLYKKTRLEDTFGVNMLTVSEGRPEVMGLKKIIESHVDFQFNMANRKYSTLLGIAKEKKEIQEGLIRACDVIDLIIEILRGSKDKDQAKRCLTEGFVTGIRFRSAKSRKDAGNLNFSEKQADAILQMRLYRLIGLEIEQLMAEYEETLKKISHYEELLNDYDAMAKSIISDLEAIKKEYGKKRKTLLEDAEEVVYEQRVVEAVKVVFLMDRFGYAKTVDPGAYEKNREQLISESRFVFSCMNDDSLCIFTDDGKMHIVRVSALPYCKYKDKGVPVDNVSNYDSKNENILCVMPMSEVPGKALLFVTSQGMVKIVSGEQLEVISKKTIASTKLLEGDRLVFVGDASLGDQIVLRSEGDFFIRFEKKEIPEKKKNAIGVRGMKLDEGDRIAMAYLIDSSVPFEIPFNERKINPLKLKLAKRDGKGSRQK